MKHCWLLLPLFSACLSNQDAAVNNAANQWCESNNDVEARIGEKLNLISHVDPDEECYFVLTKIGTDNQCCYEGPSKKFCEISKKYKQGNETKCLKEVEYSVVIESKISETCILKIETFSKDASGDYKSYRGALKGDHDEIQECNVRVRAEADGVADHNILVVSLAVTSAVLLLLLLLLTFLVYKGQRRPIIEDYWDDGDNLVEMLTQPRIYDETDGKKKGVISSRCWHEDDDDDDDNDEDEKDDKKEKKKDKGDEVVVEVEDGERKNLQDLVTCHKQSGLS